MICLSPGYKGAMSPRTRIRAAQALIPIAFVIGIVSVLLGLWWTVIAMALLIVGQVINIRSNQRRLR